MTKRHQYILKKSYEKKVLHVGCCDTPLMKERIKTDKLLHFQLNNVTKELYGFDISKDDIHFLQKEGTVSNLTAGNCENIAEYYKNEKFEVIEAGELEHLNNPGKFLSSIKKLMSSESILIISVPNGIAFRRGISSLLRRETVHSDHNFYFSKKTVKNLMMRNGFDICEVHGYRVTYKKLFLSYVSDALASLLSEFACEGIILTAKMASN